MRTPSSLTESLPTVRSGRLVSDAAIFAAPESDGNSLDTLAAGHLVIITGEDDSRYEIIYGDGPGGHGWLEKSYVTFEKPTRPAVSSRRQQTPTPPTQDGPDSLQPQLPDATSAAGTVLASRLNVRSGPGTGNPTVGQISAGERVDILNRQEGWLQILHDDKPAWISASFVAVDGEPTPVPPAGPPVPGTIVFQTRNGGDIFLMGADGSDLRRLTRGFDPALSPNGSQVAFTRWDEPRGLWVIDKDGSNERLLVGEDQARSPTWAPDGNSIIFERATKSKSCRDTPFGCYTDEYLLALNNGQNCVTTEFGTFCIDDFPIVTRFETGLTQHKLADGSNRDLPGSESAASPYHSPVDDRVLFLDRDGLATTRTSGEDQPRRLVQAPTFLEPGVFSPDGQFVYGSRRSGDHREIWRWRSDSGQAQLLTPHDPLIPWALQNVAPAVSPDGQHILFLTNRRGVDQWELWIMNADGSNPRPLAPEALADVEFTYEFARERMIDWGQ
ncbi:MAG: SH3 domain-containing protein [Chloroflexota bacterium]|nr:SH3 domain-containing protein [Chloroflexota bacterium]